MLDEEKRILLQGDMTRCGRELAGELERLAQRARTTTIALVQRNALSGLEVARALAKEPWFGWLEVDEDGARKTFRIAAGRYPALRIVDWRHPLGRIFYELDTDDDYERPAGDGTIEGICRAKARVSSESYVLTSVEWRDADGTSHWRTDSGFVHEPAAAGPSARAEPVRAPEKRRSDLLPNVLSLLTPEQYRLIASSTDRPLIIQGKAGSGKTTVALYRVSWLTWGRESDDENLPGIEGRGIDPANVLVVMFNKALQRFVSGALRDLQLDDVQLATFHSWALAAVKAAYSGELELTFDKLEGHEVAERAKAHRGILKALEELVEGQVQKMELFLEAELGERAPEWWRRYRSSQGAPVPRLVALRKQARDEARTSGGPEVTRAGRAAEVLAKAARRMTRYKEELRSFLTNQELLARHLDGLTQQDLDALASYQRALQAGEGNRVGKRVDGHDLALLLRLIQLKNGGLARGEEVQTYDHIVIDEAQDFGAVQLAALIGAVRSRTGLTIVGDVNQKILPTVEFVGWEALATELGMEGIDVAQLEVGHRSTAPIMRLAEHVAGLPHSDDGRPGAAPLLCRTATLDEGIERVLGEILQLQLDRAPCHVAVVLPGYDALDRTLNRLRAGLKPRGIDVRLGRRESFVFQPGVTVTTRHQVKGLEFDVVIALGVGPEDYPASDQGRRDLYTTLTRAVEKLYAVSTGAVSPLLEDALRKGLLLEPDEAPF